MDGNWWRRPEDLDDDQKAFITLPARGRYILTGPPGSGKTNLLLLRAEYIAGTGEKNVLVVTYTNLLANFIQSGVRDKGFISASQVRTFHSWANEHIKTYTGEQPIARGADFDDEARKRFSELLVEANRHIPSKNLYSAILVDEAQDLSRGELENLLCLSENICVCGDSRQGIYKQDGLSIGEALGLEEHNLRRHYRIGQQIAKVADRLIEPENPASSLEANSNYNAKLQGESSAIMHECADRDEQFTKLCELLDVQLVAFKSDDIGIFCPTKGCLGELKNRFSGTKYESQIEYHDGTSVAGGFSSGNPIHIMTIHSAKGAEFRAVHLFGVEEMKGFPMNNRLLGYTAITRAKTALNAYKSGETNKPLERAFSEPTLVDLKDIFPETV